MNLGHAVFVLAGLGAGGAERVVSLIANDWIARGCAVTVIAFDSPQDPIYHRFSPGIDLVRLAISAKSGGRLTQARRVVALRRELRRAAPTVIVSFLTKINALTLLASYGMRVPVIVSERNNPRMQTVHRGWYWLLAALYHRAATIVLQTEASRDCLPDGARGKAVVIPNPIVAPDHAPIVLDGPILAAVGRLEPQKGFDMLLEAFARVVGDHPDWTLVIWGDGAERAELESRVAALGLDRRVQLPGLSATPGSWTQRASAFVLTSRFEGFPNVLGEAMAAGLPVAAFDCAFGPREMIVDGVDGLLVENGDVAALAATLRRLMIDRGLRARLGLAAKTSIQRYGAEPVLGQWRNLIAPGGAAMPGRPSGDPTHSERPRRAGAAARHLPKFTT